MNQEEWAQYLIQKREAANGGDVVFTCHEIDNLIVALQNPETN